MVICVWLKILYVVYQGILSSIRTNNSNAGTYSKLDCLRHLLNLPNAPAVLALTETKLSSRITDNKVSINGYTFFRRDRSRQGGGVAVFCRSDLRSTIITDFGSYNLKTLAVKLFLLNNKPVVIRCVYRPPSSNADWLNSFFATVCQLTVLHPSTIIIGDFNIDLLKSSEFCDEMRLSFGLNQLIMSLTRITANSATLIDHVYSSCDVMAAGTCKLHIADHHVAFCCLNSSTPYTSLSQHHRVTEYRSFKTFD